MKYLIRWIGVFFLINIIFFKTPICAQSQRCPAKGEIINKQVSSFQLEEKVGVEKFKEANDKYNRSTNDKLLELSRNEEFSRLPNDEKVKVINGLKTKIKTDIFESNDFKKDSKQTEAEKKEAQKVKDLIKKYQ